MCFQKTKYNQKYGKILKENFYMNKLLSLINLIPLTREQYLNSFKLCAELRNNASDCDHSCECFDGSNTCDSGDCCDCIW